MRMNLALFDLDNTLLAGDSDYGWTLFLVNKGVLDRATFEARNADFLRQYQAGTLDIEEFAEFQLRPLKNNSRADLDAWHAEFMRDIIRPMIGEKARELVRNHLERGDLCALVTATNSFIVAPIAREFKLPHLIATVAEQENGEFNGHVRGVHAFREGKIARVEAWLESMALSIKSFTQSYFYSDSHNDLPLMSCVSNPVAVDPDHTLRAHAQQANWPIISLL